jgi:hypothetical protein
LKVPRGAGLTAMRRALSELNPKDSPDEQLPSIARTEDTPSSQSRS